MSSTVATARTRIPRLAEEAVQRARLTVVPRARTAGGGRVPFVTLVSLVLLAGVVGLLLFNTSMQQASFREEALEQQARDLGARQEALELEVAGLSDRQRVARVAQEDLGMVIPVTPPGVLRLADGSISGDPVPATGAGAVPLFPPATERPAGLDPPPVVERRADRGGSQGNGAPDRDGGFQAHRLGSVQQARRR